jgi:DNA polymerase (family 10)
MLDIRGSNPFRIRAYRNAARTVSNTSDDLTDMVEHDEDLTKLPDIGKDLAEKIKIIVAEGNLAELESLKRELPIELLDVIGIDALGPKRTGRLYRELGIKNITDLKTAAEGKRIRELPGFGAKTEENILQGIETKEKTGTESKRFSLSFVEKIAESLLAYLRKTEGIRNVEIAGSYRRKKETIGDLDILVTHKKDSGVMKRFVKYEDVNRVVSHGKTRSTVILKSGIQVDLRAIPAASYGAGMLYFTGSKAHNIALRNIAIKIGLKINEYGIYKKQKKMAGKTEEDIYRNLDLPYIEPELRENNGEIEAAKGDSLPDLISLEDIKGDLHIHTRETDGHSNLEEMANAARKKGYEYLAVSDHSKRVTVAGGLDAERLSKQIDVIDRLNEKLEDITLLKSVELDILKNGSLDLPDKVLKKLDLIICAVHYSFDLPEDRQTERIIRGLDNPYFTILAHPTGRMIGKREPYKLDMEKLMKGVKETGSVLEINAQPERLDLTEIYSKMAKEYGVLLTISTDAHSTQELDFMRFGIYQARRGWIEADDVLNTLKWKELKKRLTSLNQRRLAA